MRYAISYVSTVASDLPIEEAKDLLKNATKNNNRQDITGILLYSASSFFQLIEGEKAKILELYSHIENDSRHNNIIKFIDMEVTRPAYDGYMCGVIKDSTKYQKSNLKNYLRYIEVLDPSSQKAIKRVIETILM